MMGIGRFVVLYILSSVLCLATPPSVYTGVAKKVSPAVVDLACKHVQEVFSHPLLADPFFSLFFDITPDAFPRKRILRSTGSGSIISADGLVVTCAHVVDGAAEITARLDDGTVVLADIVKIHKPLDIAFLKLRNEKGKVYPFLELNAALTVDVGTEVLASGNAFDLSNTITRGIISSTLRIINRKLMWQTDAAINPGNSGGALVDMDGKLLGVPNAILSKTGASHGIGFAIPGFIVQALQRTLDGAYQAAWFGIYGQTLTPDLLASMEDNTLLGLQKGVIVKRLHEESPAKKAGVQVGDIITLIDGIPLQHEAEIKYRQLNATVGQTIVVTIVRNGKTQNISFVTTAAPDSKDQIVLNGNHPFDGLAVASFSPAIALKCDVEEETCGVIVVKDFRVNKSKDVDIPAGACITQINDIEVKTPRDLEKALEKPTRELVVMFAYEGKGYILREAGVLGIN